MADVINLEQIVTKALAAMVVLALFVVHGCSYRHMPSQGRYFRIIGSALCLVSILGPWIIDKTFKPPEMPRSIYLWLDALLVIALPIGTLFFGVGFFGMSIARKGARSAEKGSGQTN